MDAGLFREALLVLRNITADQFSKAFFSGGAMWNDSLAVGYWNIFQKDPVKFYIHGSDDERDKLFGIIMNEI